MDGFPFWPLVEHRAGQTTGCLGMHVGCNGGLIPMFQRALLGQ